MSETRSRKLLLVTSEVQKLFNSTFAVDASAECFSPPMVYRRKTSDRKLSWEDKSDIAGEGSLPVVK
jgi:hypothetical protein